MVWSDESNKEMIHQIDLWWINIFLLLSLEQLLPEEKSRKIASRGVPNRIRPPLCFLLSVCMQQKENGSFYLLSFGVQLMLVACLFMLRNWIWYSLRQICCWTYKYVQGIHFPFQQAFWVLPLNLTLKLAKVNTKQRRNIFLNLLFNV